MSDPPLPFDAATKTERRFDNDDVTASSGTAAAANIPSRKELEDRCLAASYAMRHHTKRGFDAALDLAEALNQWRIHHGLQGKDYLAVARAFGVADKQTQANLFLFLVAKDDYTKTDNRQMVTAHYYAEADRAASRGEIYHYPSWQKAVAWLKKGLAPKKDRKKSAAAADTAAPEVIEDAAEDVRQLKIALQAAKDREWELAAENTRLKAELEQLREQKEHLESMLWSGDQPAPAPVPSDPVPPPDTGTWHHHVESLAQLWAVFDRYGEQYGKKLPEILLLETGEYVDAYRVIIDLPDNSRLCRRVLKILDPIWRKPRQAGVGDNEDFFKLLWPLQYDRNEYDRTEGYLPLMLDTKYALLFTADLQGFQVDIQGAPVPSDPTPEPAPDDGEDEPLPPLQHALRHFDRMEFGHPADDAEQVRHFMQQVLDNSREIFDQLVPELRQHWYFPTDPDDGVSKAEPGDAVALIGGKEPVFVTSTHVLKVVGDKIELVPWLTEQVIKPPTTPAPVPPAKRFSWSDAAKRVIRSFKAIDKPTCEQVRDLLIVFDSETESDDDVSDDEYSLMIDGIKRYGYQGHDMPAIQKALGSSPFFVTETQVLWIANLKFIITEVSGILPPIKPKRSRKKS